MARGSSDDGAPTLPLFPAPTKVAKRARPPVSRPVAWGQCPRCRSAERHALIRSATHLIWRPHHYITWGGARVECDASNVAVCQAPSRSGLVPCDCGANRAR